MITRTHSVAVSILTEILPSMGAVCGIEVIFVDFL